MSPRFFKYGVAVDKGMVLAFFLGLDPDNNLNYKAGWFAINRETQERYFEFDAIGKVAISHTGKIYIIDEAKNKIAFWQIHKSILKNKDAPTPGYKPFGAINIGFDQLKDIYCDNNNFLYILDSGTQRVYKYSTQENRFLSFENNLDYIDLSDYVSGVWDNPVDLVTSGDDIFIIFKNYIVRKIETNGKLKSLFDFTEHFRYQGPEVEIEEGVIESELYSPPELVSIAMGPSGHIFVLDLNEKAVHIFNNDLDFITAWKDEEHPIEASATDICFNRDAKSFFISHPWGFYSYKTKIVNGELIP